MTDRWEIGTSGPYSRLTIEQLHALRNALDVVLREPDEGLACPSGVESAEGFYDPAGYEGDDGWLACAGCGANRREHRRQGA